PRLPVESRSQQACRDWWLLLEASPDLVLCPWSFVLGPSLDLGRPWSLVRPGPSSSLVLRTWADALTVKGPRTRYQGRQGPGDQGPRTKDQGPRTDWRLCPTHV